MDSQQEQPQTSHQAGGAKQYRLAMLRKDPRGWTVLMLSVVSVIAFLGAAFGTAIGLWGWKTGMAIVPWTGLLAIIALAIAALGIFWDRRKGRKTRWLVTGLGIIVALGFIGYLGNYVVARMSLPAIHDITTDLADPPQFSALNLRADNLDNIPGANDKQMRGMNPRQRWATLHQRAYPDVRSVRIDQPVPLVIERAERLANDRGWEVASVDPASGHLEATATYSLFRLKSDIVIRARPAQNGQASIIDMRSVSRVGVHDLGENAKLVRQFLSDLSGTTTAASQ